MIQFTVFTQYYETEFIFNFNLVPKSIFTYFLQIVIYLLLYFPLVPPDNLVECLMQKQMRNPLMRISLKGTYL